MSDRARMIAPDGVCDISVEGSKIEVKDGIAEVLPHQIEVLRSHGFTLEGGQDDFVEDPGDRANMIRMMVDPTRTVAESMSDQELISFTRLPAEARQKFWEGLGRGLREYPEHSRKEAERAEQARREADEAAKADTAARAKKADEDRAKAEAERAQAEDDRKRAEAAQKDRDMKGVAATTTAPGGPGTGTLASPPAPPAGKTTEAAANATDGVAKSTASNDKK